MQSSPYIFVLLPDNELAGKTIATSHKLASLRPTYFTLEQETNSPHMTLYMAQLPNDSLEKVQSSVSEIVTNFSFQLQATKYAQDNEGMIEVQYERTESLITIQKQLIKTVNPLRDGLRERSPLGYLLRDQLAKATGEEKENLEKFGYDEIGSLFRPHITFTRFKDKEQQFDMSLMPDVTTFSGAFTKIGLFILGDHGTCVKQIASWESTT